MAAHYIRVGHEMRQDFLNVRHLVWKNCIIWSKLNYKKAIDNSGKKVTFGCVREVLYLL